MKHERKNALETLTDSEAGSIEVEPNLNEGTMRVCLVDEAVPNLSWFWWVVLVGVVAGSIYFGELDAAITILIASTGMVLVNLKYWILHLVVWRYRDTCQLVNKTISSSGWGIRTHELVLVYNGIKETN